MHSEVIRVNIIDEDNMQSLHALQGQCYEAGGRQMQCANLVSSGAYVDAG